MHGPKNPEMTSSRGKDGSKMGWNELQFLSWSAFRQMAPSIVQLEINRLSKLMRTLHRPGDYYNAIVRARFELKQFVACVERTEKDMIETTCAPHLRAAAVNISFEPDGLDAATKATCDYVLDRLNYILDSIRLIY